MIGKVTKGQKMVRISEIARFTKQNGFGKKNVQAEIQRAAEFKREQEKTVAEMITEMVSDIPGLTSKDIQHKLSKHGHFDGATSMLARMAGKGELKRRQQDGYWRYYAKNFLFSEDIKAKAEEMQEEPKEPKFLGQRNMTVAAQYMANNRGKLQKDVSQELIANPGQSYNELYSKIGRKFPINRMFKQGKVTRETVNGIYRYSWVDKKSKVKKGSRLDQAMQLIKKAPGSTQGEVQELLGGSKIDLWGLWHRGLIDRVMVDTLWHYYPKGQVPSGEVVETAKTEEVEKPKKIEKADWAEFVKPEELAKLMKEPFMEMAKDVLTAEQQAIWTTTMLSSTAKTLGVNAFFTEQLAMQYFWETKSDSLRGFVEWVKDQEAKKDEG